MKNHSKKAALLLFIAFSFISHTSTKTAPLTDDQRQQQNPGIAVIYIEPAHLNTPYRNPFQNIPWTIYTYSLVEVLCQRLICGEKTNQKESIGAQTRSTIKAVFWGGIKELFIRFLWENNQQGKAVIAHLILQNLCLLRQTPTAESFKKMIAESACKTLMPPLLLNARNLRANALHTH